MHTQSIISKRINAIICTCCNFDIIDLIHAFGSAIIIIISAT